MRWYHVDMGRVLLAIVLILGFLEVAGALNGTQQLLGGVP